MAHDVFISYSTKDRAIADDLCIMLETNGVKCWMAPRDILSGQNWPQAITSAIAASRLMVLVFSSRSNKSEDVTREVYQAVQKKIKIIPFRVERVALSDELAYLIGSLQWLDASKPPTKGDFEQLARKVCLLLGRRLDDDAGREPAAVAPDTNPDRPEKSLGGLKRLIPATGERKSPAISGGRMRIAWIAGIALAMGLGGYYLLDYFFSGPLPDVITIQVDVRVEGTRAHINISDDADANIPIKVNGRFTGDSTPYSEEKHFGDKLVLTLSKDGYKEVNLSYTLRSSFREPISMVKKAN